MILWNCRRTIARLTSLLCLIGALCWAAFPILFLGLSSFKLPKDIFAYPPRLAFTPVLINYLNLIELHREFFRALANSAIIAVLATVVALGISIPAGYVFSRYRSRFLSLAAFFTVAVRMLPPMIISVPLFPILHIVGFFDRHITLVILYATFFVSLTTWIMKAFIDTIPIELEEAAWLDGCTRVKAITKIVLPLTLPGVMTASIFVLTYCWNEFFFAFLFTGTRSRTAPIIINELMGGFFGAEWGMVFAACTLQLFPVLLFVLFGHRMLITGMTIGALKG